MSVPLVFVIDRAAGCAQAPHGEGGADSDGPQARPGKGPLAPPPGDDVLLRRALQVKYSNIQLFKTRISKQKQDLAFEPCMKYYRTAVFTG